MSPEWFYGWDQEPDEEDCPMRGCVLARGHDGPHDTEATDDA